MSESMQEPTQPQFKSIKGFRYNLDSPQEYLDIGEKLTCDGRFGEAAEVLREAVDRFDDSRSYLDLGIALFLTLKDSQSKATFWQDLSMEEELSEECVFSLEEALSRDSRLTPAYNLLGRMYALRGRPEEALQAWKSSLAIDPEQDHLREEMKFFQDEVMSDQKDPALLDTRPNRVIQPPFGQ